jgi:hypothetical protein
MGALLFGRFEIRATHCQDMDGIRAADVPAGI